VRMVRTLRAELGTGHGTVQRVARQRGYGIESVRSWVRQTDIDDGYALGVSSAEAQRIEDPEQQNRELKRTIVILRRAVFLQGRNSTANTNQVVAFIDADRDEFGASPSSRCCTAQDCRRPRARITRPRHAHHRHRPQRDVVMGPIVDQLWRDNIGSMAPARSGKLQAYLRARDDSVGAGRCGPAGRSASRRHRPAATVLPRNSETDWCGVDQYHQRDHNIHDGHSRCISRAMRESSRKSVRRG
jgi:transposase